MSLRFFLITLCLAVLPPFAQANEEKIPAGKLDAIDAAGQSLGSCPLKHTAITADLSGTMARVTVMQQFHNPFAEKIEAIYVFPLDENSAVDDMEMKIGERLIKGQIKERSEAAKLYQNAKQQGHVASLLDQERPNIFTQSVANIEPGQGITITIHYSVTLTWKDGSYHFHLPTVIGPRYIPGARLPEKDKATMPSFFPESGEKTVASKVPVYPNAPASPTTQVPDADRITPPVAQQGYRAGHDFAITVNIQAGIPISDLQCDTHEITSQQPEGDSTRARIVLKEGTTLPDRDFVLRYRTAGDGITDTILTHTDERGKFFTLILQPPARVKAEQIVPRDLIFVLDTSGSMSGFPIETSKALMRKAIETLRPQDRFNLITFAGSTQMMSPKPLANTPANRQGALKFIDRQRGSGGTEMMKAIHTALAGDLNPQKVRIVCFLTDGFVGNEAEIIAAVKKQSRTTRVFSFGIGSSVNRYLLSAIAREGKGEAQFVLSHSAAEKAASQFYEWIDAPVLTDISLDFTGVDVAEMHPQRVPDLFARQPLVIKGRYKNAGSGILHLRGRNAAGAFQRDIVLNLPDTNPDNAVLAPQWARAKVEHLRIEEHQTGLSSEHVATIKNQIIELGTTYHLLTPYTSFVAIDANHVTAGDLSEIILVPLEIPHGVSPSTTLGNGEDFGAGWGSGGDGGGGGGGFGAIPATMRKRCSQEDRLERLKLHGGTPECEAAVIKSLDWLKQTQNADGSWGIHQRAAATGLALLAYLGHCETPLSEKYGESVLNAITYLIHLSKTHQGRLIDQANDPLADYQHAIATMALAESYLLCHQLMIEIPGHKDAMQLATQGIIDAALPTGGWSIAQKPNDSDALLTSINLQALKVSRQSTIDFRNMIRTASQALSALKVHKTPAGAISFSQGLWAQQDTPEARALKKSLRTREAFRWQEPHTDLWTLFFDTHALYQIGGQAWTDWNASLRPALLQSQNADGSFTDPGKPQNTAAAPIDQWLTGAPAAHFRTCLATLTLEVYYRFTFASGK